MWTGITPVPDAGFMRKLKTFDPNLDCEFNREIEKFIITQPSRLRSGRLVACVVDNPGKPYYRQPDERDLAALRRADFEAKDHKRRIIEGEEYMFNEQRKREEYAEDEIHYATRENRRQLKHMADLIAGNTGDRVNPAFRRITPKSRGYRVIDRRKLSAK